MSLFLSPPANAYFSFNHHNNPSLLHILRGWDDVARKYAASCTKYLIIKKKAYTPSVLKSTVQKT